ncbi:hypothetical protein PTSG_04478 [Salpingoeca rosetta]|uniref:THO complex subunit 1 n=1 Tax=Salpingoeca rosetta (strain ATCC 50818 / BSB-021) TaxID=946362 RepID=F2U8P0_SALR5|nr:uncharacterized protein PTSG_04478 [Salpingoeca rosetta]EGD72748.1 hypothetical protein PTSG_04478 [Salpingoeca rosetta]|eukprot:XP_004994571.1 hypothetical protein PTSG_04478 [Salpingoeca rosetta]
MMEAEAIDSISAVVQGTADTDSLASLKQAKAHIVGLAFRRVLFPLLVQRDEKCLDVLRICIECFKREFIAVAATNTVLISLFEDAFDVLPVSMCERVFTLMEQNAQQPAFVKANGPRVVRLINGLKKRLSRSQDIELSGRLLMFIASIFPMSDKSGANISSAVNVANKTHYDETEEELDTSASEAAKAQEDIDMPSLGRPLNKSDYKQFWSLQRFFCEPRLCYQPDEWKRFEKATECVLDLFERHPLEVSPVTTQPTAASMMDTNDDNGDGDGDGDDGDDDGPSQKQRRADTTFAKYLTSPKLFELQLNDVTLRREILLQLLILFSYLPRDSKFKKPAETLTSAQKEWMDKRQRQVEKLMKAAGSDGADFLTNAKRMLERELVWVQWKEDGCKPFEKKESAKRKAPSPPAPGAAGVHMGSDELQRLWTLSSTNMEACKRAKVRVPSLKEYFLDAVEEMDPAECVEEEYWQINDFRFNWKGLRLISRKKVNLFHFADQLSLKSYMESTLNILAKDFSSGTASPSAAVGETNTREGAVKAEEEGNGDAGTGSGGDDDDDDGSKSGDEGEGGEEDGEETAKMEEDDDAGDGGDDDEEGETANGDKEDE